MKFTSAFLLILVLCGEGESQSSTCPANQAVRNELNRNISAALSSVLASRARCGEAGWRRVGFLDMTDPTQNCPNGLALKNYSPTVRVCGRVTPTGGGCWSTFYDTGSSPYSRVCGRVRGYQHAATSGFGTHRNTPVQNIDSFYLEGVSLTHGAAGSRTHIWSFAAGLAEIRGPNFANQHCPCGNSPTAQAPPAFVGNDYFCESGVNRLWDGNSFVFHPEDPLWDGQNCLTCVTNCCQFNNPPYFTKTLPASTTDRIELRVCTDTDTADAPIDQVELYVQ